MSDAEYYGRRMDEEIARNRSLTTRLEELKAIEGEWLAIGAALAPFWHNQSSMKASRAAELLVASYELLREALSEIAKDAAEAPMEDMLCAGEKARKALKETPGLIARSPLDAPSIPPEASS